MLDSYLDDTIILFKFYYYLIIISYTNIYIYFISILGNPETDGNKYFAQKNNL